MPVSNTNAALVCSLWLVACGGDGNQSLDGSTPNDGAATDGGTTGDAGTPASPLPTFMRRTTQIRPLDEYESYSISSVEQQPDRSYLAYTSLGTIATDLNGQVSSWKETAGFGLSTSALDGITRRVTARLGEMWEPAIGVLQGDTVTDLQVLTAETRFITPNFVHSNSGLRLWGRWDAEGRTPDETVLLDESDPTRAVSYEVDGGFFVPGTGGDWIIVDSVRVPEFGPMIATVQESAGDWQGTHYRQVGRNVFGRLLKAGTSFVYVGQSHGEGADRTPILMGFNSELTLQWAEQWDNATNSIVQAALADGVVLAANLQGSSQRVLLAAVGNDGALRWAREVETPGAVSHVLVTDDQGLLLSGTVFVGTRNPRDFWQMHLDRDGIADGCSQVTSVTPLVTPVTPETMTVPFSSREMTVSRESRAAVALQATTATLNDRVLCGDGVGTWQSEGNAVTEPCTCSPGQLCYSSETGCDMGLICLGRRTPSGNPVASCTFNCGLSCPDGAGTCTMYTFGGTFLGSWCT